MKIGDGFAAEIDGLVFTVPPENPGNAIWKIIPEFHQGENTYL